MINIPANTISAGITLTGIHDSLIDPAETVIVDITTVVNATENGAQQVTATITDDEAPPTVTLSLSSPTFAENGGIDDADRDPVGAHDAAGDGEPRVHRAPRRTGPTTRGAAVINIPANTISAGIPLTGVDDTTFEFPNETVIVDITTVMNATENGTQQVTATITEDDPAADG